MSDEVVTMTSVEGSTLATDASITRDKEQLDDSTTHHTPRQPVPEANRDEIALLQSMLWRRQRWD